MAEAEKTRQKQVALVGSETLYKRLDQKLTDLEFDPFFYQKQCKLFKWRYKFIMDAFGRGDHLFLPFLSTKEFARVLDKLDSPDSSIQDLEDMFQMSNAGREARDKFLIPDLAFRIFFMINSRAFKENICAQEVFGLFKGLIKCYPESAAGTKLAILNSSMGSLKDLCMAKVVELGLDQDCLPRSVQQAIKTGPEFQELDRKTQISLEMFERAVKDLKP